MEKASEVSSIEFDLHGKLITMPFECLNDGSAQDAITFEEYSENDNKQSVSDCSENLIDDSKQTKNGTVNFSPKLKLNITDYFEKLHETNIHSPVSELAVNVALTKITSADSLTGEYNNSIPDDLLCCFEKERKPYELTCYNMSLVIWGARNTMCWAVASQMAAND